MKTAKRNPFAKDLAAPVFKPKIVKALKGKGSYNRKMRHSSKKIDDASFFVCGISSGFYNGQLFRMEGSLDEVNQTKECHGPVCHSLLFSSSRICGVICL